MATLITNEKLSKHNVNKYNFKVLSLNGDTKEHKEEFVSSLVSSSQEQTQEMPKNSVEDEPQEKKETEIDASSMSKNSKDALIESLMKKTDEMSSNFIKLQMKLESKEQEYLAEIKKAKEISHAEGIEAGLAQAAQNNEANLTNGITQFASSVQTLENSAKEYDKALESIKEQLVTAALDISHEVINVELSQNSSEIAKVLGDELINELQSASKITLKVNPKNHGAISEHVGKLEHVQVLSDSAISEGGVIAISDVGNIDSQISKRFERVKKEALSG